MVLSDGTSGVTEGDEGVNTLKTPPKRLTPSLARIKDFTLRIQCEVLDVLGILDDSNLSIKFLQEYGGAIRHTIETFERETGNKPTAYDILWCLGYDLHIDPRLEVMRWDVAA